MTCQLCGDESGALRWGHLADGRYLQLCYWCWVRRPDRPEPERLWATLGGAVADWERLLHWEGMVHSWP